MSKLMPGDIREAVAEVLGKASAGNGPEGGYLSAYQILDRLPEDLRARLIAERGKQGGTLRGRRRGQQAPRRRGIGGRRVPDRRPGRLLRGDRREER